MQKNIQFKHICKEDTYMFNYTQLPDDLFTIDLFSKLSLHAKVLYSFMLRRVSISKANNWIDDIGDVYIYYRIDEIMKNFNCSNKTVAKVMSELEEIGLIEKKRQGQGKPDIIYVNKFSEVAEANYDVEEPELPIEHLELLSSADMREENSRESAENSGVKKVHSQKCKNYISKNVKSTPLEVKNLQANYKENNNKNKINSSSNSSSQQNITREHVRLMEEEEEERYKMRIRYQEAERLYSARIAAAVYGELIKRNANYLEKFNAEMFSRTCKSIQQSREPIVSMPGLINWCLDRVSFSSAPQRNVSNNQFCQFPQREYNFAELERQLLEK